MVEFKKFMAVWLSVVVAVSVLTIAGTSLLESGNKELTTTNHFSVRWMGFSPTYSNQYPEYYVCINNLANDPMTMQVALQIKNQENRSFYFRIEQNQTPPTGWSLLPYTIGLINKDETKTFLYDALRSNPSSISQGRLTETISLVVKAYYDSLYTQFYSEDSFPVTFNFLDKTAVVWTTLYLDNFDDGTAHQWTAWPNFAVSTDYYRSFQYSIKVSLGGTANCYFQKSFDVSGAFSEAYLIYAIRSSQWGSTTIELNSVKYFEADISPQTNTWYQIAIRLPTAQVTVVKIYGLTAGNPGAMYLDDAYVIAK